jgi:hypothetical protein
LIACVPRWRIDTLFDHPAPVAYLRYVPLALAIRFRAAQGMVDRGSSLEDRRVMLISNLSARWQA